MKRNIGRSDFHIGDYVTFHTSHGFSTGIIETIYLWSPSHREMKVSPKYKGELPGTYQIALITVRNMTGKPKKYHRALYKLKKVV